MSQLEDKAINYERMAKSLKYIKLYIDKFKSGEIDETKLKEQINVVAEENGYVTKDKLNLETINDVNIDDTITGDFVALVKTKNGWTNENLEVQEYTKEELLEKLGLTTEDIETITNILTDSSVVSTTKTWNSSAIYTELKNTKEGCNDYTLKQIAKSKKISYKIVSTKDEMTDTTLIYLMLDSATNKYDMYVKDSVDSEPTKIGNTDINLSDYVLLTELETKYYTKEDCDTKFATITELDKKVEKVEGKSLVLDTEIEKIHKHDNLDSLNKISEDENGNPLYNGKLIQAEKEIWTGTKEEYNAITDKKDDITYIVTDEEDNLDINNLVIDDTKTSDKTTWSSNKINEENKEIYSTDEIKTNKVWIDGKPIYRKIYTSSDFDFIDNAQQGTSKTNISNIEDLVDISGRCKAPLYFVPVNIGKWRGDATGAWSFSMLVKPNGQIVLDMGTSVYSAKNNIKIVVEYTKTID